MFVVFILRRISFSSLTDELQVSFSRGLTQGISKVPIIVQEPSRKLRVQSCLTFTERIHVWINKLIQIFLSHCALAVRYGVLGGRELLNKTYKNLEQRVHLECDGHRIALPSLQGESVMYVLGVR